MELKRHTPFRLSREGYRELCRLVDERDGGQCIICGRQEVQHHHVIFRSKGGEDRISNLVCLCPVCHQVYAHGVDEKRWRSEFLKYLRSSPRKRFKRLNRRRLRSVYREEGG